ncbi:MAG: LysR family transcriptional regulator [Gammaproteobacteria bacterium]|nr:LysR family transcriptional regulator [Gammaproteobacteria bacterium]MDH5802922.1 LysR family transcriptional regulator [Gammaproteobacteria bacterium]
MNNVEWSLIRSFLMVAEQGSLSAAARQLGVSQPTLTRDIQALESGSGLNLFRRTTRGLQLTESGQSLVDAASRMATAANDFNRLASGLSSVLEGSVRISANEIVGIYLLPKALAKFREQHPGVQIEIVISNQVSSLSKREADIALRMFRPTQPDLVAQRLADMPLGFYAHRDYVKRLGEPKSIAELQSHTMIGYDESTEYIEEAAKLGFPLVRQNFALRTDHLLAQINLARAGAGIVGGHVALAKLWPELVPVMQWVPLPVLEFWIVCHSDVQYNSRIRALMRFLADWFKADPYENIML